jgi:hypothetical protein
VTKNQAEPAKVAPVVFFDFLVVVLGECLDSVARFVMLGLAAETLHLRLLARTAAARYPDMMIARVATFLHSA